MTFLNVFTSMLAKVMMLVQLLDGQMGDCGAQQRLQDIPAPGIHGDSVQSKHPKIKVIQISFFYAITLHLFLSNNFLT